MVIPGKVHPDDPDVRVVRVEDTHTRTGIEYPSECVCPEDDRVVHSDRNLSE
jgi:hypothetical protein